MTGINEVRERLDRALLAGMAPMFVEDVDALLADHARLQEIVNASVIYSDSDGDYWVHDPADADFVEGLSVGDEYELLVGLEAVRRKFCVTKVPDASSDDYEVEEVQS